MNNVLKRKGWRWVGHSLRIEPSAHASIALTWTPESRRKRGRPRGTWRRTMLGAIGRSWNGVVSSSEKSPGQR